MSTYCIIEWSGITDVARSMFKHFYGNSGSLTVRSPIFSFKYTVHAVGRFDLLTEKGNIIVRKDRCVKCVLSLPWAQPSVSTVGIAGGIIRYHNSVKRARKMLTYGLHTPQ